MAVGDTIQLKKNGANFGTTHTVSTTEITNVKAVINVAKSDLSSNSNTTTITATITDIVGNTSVISNAQNIVLDTTNPTLTNVVLVGDVNKTVVEATDNVLSFTAEIDSTVKVVFTGTNGAITKNITSASGMVKPLVSLVILSLLLPVLSSSAKFKLIGAVGACVSRIKLPALLIIVLPATSVAVVLTLTTPSPKVVKSLAIKAINSVVPEAEVIFLVIAPFVPVNTTFTVLSGYRLVGWFITRDYCTGN
jgi:hypothetical protein